MKALGSQLDLRRLAHPDQTHIALLLAGTPLATWNGVARDLVSDPAYNVGLADSARLFAMQNLSRGGRFDQLLERQVFP